MDWKITSINPKTGDVEVTARQTADKLSFNVPKEHRTKALHKVYIKTKTDAFEKTLKKTSSTTSISIYLWIAIGIEAIAIASLLIKFFG